MLIEKNVNLFLNNWIQVKFGGIIATHNSSKYST